MPAMPRPVINKESRIQLGQIIREYRKKRGLDQAEAARQIGVSKSSYSNWELGLARPDLETVPRVCATLRIPLHVLMQMKPEVNVDEHDRRVLKVYHALSHTAQKSVDAFLAQLYQQEKKKTSFRRTLFMEEAAAAGFGAPMDGSSPGKEVFVRDNPASRRGALIIKINGHSMEPEFADGSMVYVDPHAEMHTGDLGIFVYEGTSYFKELGVEGLVSLNPDYPMIRITDNTAFRTVGKVIGRVGDFDLLEGEELKEALAQSNA